MKKELKSILLEIGITHSQVLTYFGFLENPLRSVLEISKILGLNRQQIYNDAEKLVQLGLLERTSKTKRRYLAGNPLKIKEILKEREEKANLLLKDVETIIPLLQNSISQYKTFVRTKFYEGEQELKEAYADELLLAKGSVVLSLVGDISETYDMFPVSFWDSWNRKFVKNGGSSRMIINNSFEAQKIPLYDPHYKRETRHIKDFNLKINIDIFNDSVLLVSFKDKIALSIQSNIIASSYKILFETLWSFAKKNL